MKCILLFASLAIIGFIGCQNEMPSAPAAQSSSLDGTWNYVSTDGQDLSDYGITYSFNGDHWTYTLGDAGSKEYRITTNGDSMNATLLVDNLHSSDAIGSTLASSYSVQGDTLKMQAAGHTAILTRQ